MQNVKENENLNNSNELGLEDLKANSSVKYIIEFCILALLIGAIGYTPSILSSYGLAPDYLAIIFVIIEDGSPTFAALLITILQFGKNGPDVLFTQFKLRDANKKMLLISILLPIFIVLSVIGLFIAFGNSVDFSKLNPLEFIPIFISMIINNIWEEIGWRGYLLPYLQSKLKPIISALIVGVVVAVWHTPLFIVKDSQILENYGNYFIIFIMVLIGAILNTYIYNASNENLMLRMKT
ncbi:MAG: CPBP family intramembrane glutamic endopeptidase [Promethearchaeota archaeon]